MSTRTVNAILKNGWEMVEVDELPPRTKTGKPARLSYVVEELVKNPGTPFRLFTSNNYKKVAGRGTSIRNAIKRAGYSTDDFTIQTTKDWHGEAALFASYDGKEVR